MELTGSRRIILWLLLSFAFAGFVDGGFPSLQDASFVIHMLFIAVAMFVWCGKHAWENGIFPPGWAKIMCAGFAIVGVPLYLFRAFGFKQGGIKLLLAIAGTVAAFVLYEVMFALAGTL